MTTPDRDREHQQPHTARTPTDQAERGTTSTAAPSRVGPMGATALRQLQRHAGNRAVAGLVAQRQARPKGPEAPSAAPTTGGPAAQATAELQSVQLLAEGAAPRHGPATDPKFTALTADIKGRQKVLAAHPPVASQVDAAAKAAKPPADDRLAQGKTANAEKMNAARPGEFNKAAFIAAVNTAIARQAPKNLDEADRFGSSGKADAVRGEVSGKVTDGRAQSAAAIETTTKAPPDTGAAREKPVTPLAPDRPPATPSLPDPGRAVPDKAPAAATDFSQGPRDVNQQMADAEVTETQLATSHEPEFTDALKEKKTGEAHAATAPRVVRGKEAAILAGAKAGAQQQGAAAMQAMAVTRNRSGQDVTSGKKSAQSENEKNRAEVATKMQAVFDATKSDVEAVLSGLDKKVDDRFTRDEKLARDAFTADHQRRMDAYKDKRYSGWTGGLKWAKDKLLGMPEEANQIFVESRNGYVAAMQGVISGIADVIAADLNSAKARIAKGRTDLRAAVDALPKHLQAIGKQAAGEFSGRFDELTESVDNKGTGLVDTLATKYTDALKSVDEEIAAEKEKNKGLVAKAMDAVAGVVRTILELKDLLLGILAKAAAAIGAIISDPIGFLGHLISAVGSGLASFIANIGTHLKKGLVSWLLGSLAQAGIELPATFDLKGILGMVGSLLGLTWASIKGRVIAKGVPAEAMGAVEQGVPMAQKIQSGGIGALWEDIKDKIGDLKANLLGKISEYLIPTVLVAGITWIVSLLNPASAFVKACKAIIDIVTFIVTRGAQIAEFVNAVLDSVIAIAKGGAGGVGALIENALAKSIPVLIGFLAALLGIGGIADKVKKFFQALSKPVMKAVDWVVSKIVGFAKKIWAKLKGTFGKGAAGKEQSGKDRPGRDPAIREKVARDVDAKLADGVDDKRVKPTVREIFARWKPHGLSMLEVKPGAAPGRFAVNMAASPVTKIRDTTVDPGDAQARQWLENGQPYAEFGFDVPRNVVLSGSFKALGQPAGYSETHAVADLHTAKRVISYPKVMSKASKPGEEGPHAEDGIIAGVKSTWDSKVGPPSTEEKPGAAPPRATLDLKVTRSPCPRCAMRLGELRSWALRQKSWDLGLDVNTIQVYHVKEERVSAKGKVTNPLVPDREGLRILKEWGITVRVMDVNDPAIQKNWANSNLTEEQLLLLAVKISDQNAKLARAIEELAPVPVTMREI